MVKSLLSLAANKLIWIFALLISTNIGYAQQTVSAWEFYCKYFSNATSANLNWQENGGWSDINSLTGSARKEVLNHSKFDLRLNKNTGLSNLNIDFSVNYYSYGGKQEASYEGIFQAKLSEPYFRNNAVEWYSAASSITNKSNNRTDIKTSVSPWQLQMSDFNLKNVNGDVYTFTCKSTTTNLNKSVSAPSNRVDDSPIVYPISFGEIKLNIPASTLSQNDEFGTWTWNSNRTEFQLKSNGSIWYAEKLILHITKESSKLKLSLISPTTVLFKNPISKTSIGRPVYEVNFCFGDKAIPIKFIGKDSRDLNIAIDYGSYNRLSEELDLDASSFINQLKQYKYCSITIGTGLDTKSFVFTLEGLSSILDYIH